MRARIGMTIANKRFVLAVEEVSGISEESFRIAWMDSGGVSEQWIWGRSRVSKWMADCPTEMIALRLRSVCLGGKGLKGRVVECAPTATRPMQAFIWTSAEGN